MEAGRTAPPTGGARGAAPGALPTPRRTGPEGDGALKTPKLRPASPERARLDPAATARLAHGVRGLAAGPRPWCAGAVAVVGRGPAVAVTEATGWAFRYRGYDPGTDRGIELRPDSRRPVTPDTPFDLASLTKLFTTVAAMQQCERGAVGLDEPVDRHLPDFTGLRGTGTTLRALLTHTAGLPAEVALYDCPDAETRAAHLREQRPTGPRGGHRYSDVGMLLVQQLLERVSGQPLDVLVRDGITGPLGMTATGFGPCPGAAATEDQRRPWARVDRGMLRGEVHDENAWALGGVAGHAGLFGTAGDLAVFCRALLGGGSYGTARVLAPATVDTMLARPGLGFLVDQEWFMGALSGRGAAGHTGFTGTSLVLDRATDTFAVLLANTVHPRRRPPDNAPRAALGSALAAAVG